MKTVASEKTTTTTRKQGKRKWLGRLGTFLMGGWMLVILVVFAIVILVSVLTS